MKTYTHEYFQFFIHKIKKDIVIYILQSSKKNPSVSKAAFYHIYLQITFHLSWEKEVKVESKHLYKLIFIAC